MEKLRTGRMMLSPMPRLVSARGRAILASAGLVLLLCTLVGLMAWYAHSERSTRLSLERRSIVAVALNDLRAQYLLGASAMATAAFAEDRTPFIELFSEVEARGSADFDMAYAELRALDDRDALARLSACDERVASLEREGAKYIASVLDPNADALLESARQYQKYLWPEVQSVMQQLGQLADDQQAKLAAERTAADAAQDRNLALLVGFTIFALVAGVSSLLVLNLSVVRPLASLQQSVRAISSGDLEAKAAVSGPQEVASLARDFNEMVTARREAEEALREKDQRYRSLFERSLDAIYVHDFKGRFLDANDAALGLLGYPREEVSSLTFAELLDQSELRVALAALDELLKTGRQSKPTTFTLRRKDGSFIQVETMGATIHERGQPVAIQGIARDITARKQVEEALRDAKKTLELKVRQRTRQLAARNQLLLGEVAERRRAEEALRENEAKYRDLVENINEVIYSLDEEGRITYVSPVSEQIGGYAPSEVMGRSFTEFVHPDDLPDLIESYQRTVSGNLEPSEYRIVTKSGEIRWVRTSSRPVYDGGRIVGLRAVLMDITERRQAESQVKYLAYHDGLTGLPNRTLLKDRLATALAQRRRDGQSLAVMFVDLDRFKLVNDAVGHAVGDEALQGVAERLLGIVREGDTVARLGGDEFTVLLPAVSGVEDACEVAERTLERLRKPWTLAGHEFHLSASVGIAMYPQDGDDAEALLRNADTAMYRAKEQGRDRFQLFAAAMNAQVRDRVSLESDLRHALERGEITLHYQLQVNIESNQIVGMEALARWQHPERGLLLPEDFIPLAEETGLIVPLGEWVLRTACAQCKAYQEAGLPPVRVAVNLSSRQFQDPGLVATVTEVLKETALDPEYLDLEITEGTAMRDVEFTIDMLRELRGMGVHVSIDDFGTGYSSLAYMKRLPIDSVKIDGSFVGDAPTSPDDAAIVTAILALARTLNLRAIAEGVETEEQLAILRERRCEEAQGYLFGKPVPADVMGRILAARRPLGTVSTRRRRSGRAA